MPIRLCWWGPDGGSFLAAVHRQAREALAARADVLLTDDTPDLVLVTDPAWAATAPSGPTIHYPLGSRLPEAPAATWACSRWHERQLGTGTPRLPAGATLLSARVAAPADITVLIVAPADTWPPEDLLERLDEAGHVIWQDRAPAEGPVLPLEPAERAALWETASAVVMLPGCVASLALALEIRSAGVPVLVPKGDPADELLLVPGIGSYGTSLGDPPVVDAAAVVTRLTRMADRGFAVKHVDLSAWSWSAWAANLVALAATCGAPAAEAATGDPDGAAPAGPAPAGVGPAAVPGDGADRPDTAEPMAVSPAEAWALAATLPEAWADWQHRPLSVAEARRLGRWLGPAPAGDPVAPGRRILIVTDADGASLGSDPLFRSGASWWRLLCETMLLMPDADWRLVVLPATAGQGAPAGLTIASWLALSAPASLPLRVLPLAAAPALAAEMATADVVVTSLWSVQVAAAAQGRPVVGAGLAAARGYHPDWKVADAESLSLVLGRMLTGMVPPPAQVERSRRLAYLWRFRRLAAAARRSGHWADDVWDEPLAVPAVADHAFDLPAEWRPSDAVLPAPVAPAQAAVLVGFDGRDWGWLRETVLASWLQVPRQTVLRILVPQTDGSDWRGEWQAALSDLQGDLAASPVEVWPVAGDGGPAGLWLSASGFVAGPGVSGVWSGRALAAGLPLITLGEKTVGDGTSASAAV